MLNAINSNLTAVLGEAQVKNSTKVADITTIVNAAVGEIDALAGYFPTTDTANTDAAASAPAAS